MAEVSCPRGYPIATQWPFRAEINHFLIVVHVVCLASPGFVEWLQSLEAKLPVSFSPDMRSKLELLVRTSN